jgi:DNA methylase
VTQDTPGAQGAGRGSAGRQDVTETTIISIDDIEFVKELYPRVREDDSAIERYRAAIDRLPPIVVARGRVLVDGFHRWQAHKRERIASIKAEDLGNLSDIEIRKESIRRNASHGRQLETSDKRKQAGELYLLGVSEADLQELLSVTPSTLETYLREAKRTEKEAQQARAWDLWLDCVTDSWVKLGELVGTTDKTVKGWISEFSDRSGFSEPPESRQHFDVWSFQKANGESNYFGKMPPQVVENLLWLYTEPGDIVVDPFAGGGTTIDVAKRMGRRVWASDLHPSTPTLPIHEHDVADGWADAAPRKADLIILDPPYWQQAKGKYSDDPADLGNMLLSDFYAEWDHVIKECVGHLADDGRIAFIISPTQCDDGLVIDHALDMADRANAVAGLAVERRIIVPYQTQQATGQQVEWARENKRLLKLYRDLVVMTR